MVIPARVAKPKMMQKQRPILGGKIEKKKAKLNGKPQKALENVKNKLKNGKKVAEKLNETLGGNNTSNASQSPKRKIKKEFEPAEDLSQLSNGIEKASAKIQTNAKKIKKEKADKSSKVKEDIDSSNVTEAPAEVAASKKVKRPKKIKKSDQGNVQTGKKVVEKKQNNYSEEKVSAIRQAKVQAWKNAIALLLNKKGLKKEEILLVQKSKNYNKLPLWKKNYISWVRMDKNYQHEKFRPLIKSVYKLLKSAERKQKRAKRKASKEETSQPKATQAAIEKCIRLTAAVETPNVNVKNKKIKVEIESEGVDVDVEYPKVKVEMKSKEGQNKQSIKQKGNFGGKKNFKDLKKSTNNSGTKMVKPNKAKSFKKLKQ